MFYGRVFLPDMERLKRLECNYVLKVLEQKDFADLYLPMWGMHCVQIEKS